MADSFWAHPVRAFRSYGTGKRTLIVVAVVVLGVLAAIGSVAEQDASDDRGTLSDCLRDNDLGAADEDLELVSLPRGIEVTTTVAGVRVETREGSDTGLRVYVFADDFDAKKIRSEVAKDGAVEQIDKALILRQSGIGAALATVRDCVRAAV